MKRQAVLFKEYKRGNVLIYVDVGNASAILPYLNSEDSIQAEHKAICNILGENLRIRKMYCSAQVNDKAKNVYEMRFTRNQRNDRIYCVEVRDGRKRKIVMVELYEGKKTQKIPKKIITRLTKIGTYVYDFI